MKTLSTHEKSVIWSALYIAKERYIEDARNLRAPDNTCPPHRAAAYERMARQFDVQAAECSALIEVFE